MCFAYSRAAEDDNCQRGKLTDSLLHPRSTEPCSSEEHEQTHTKAPPPQRAASVVHNDQITPEKYISVEVLFQSLHHDLLQLSPEASSIPPASAPCPPCCLQLVVSKSSGVKKQEAMQRRERIQIEARNCSSSPAHTPPPLPFPPPYHSPSSG